MSVISIDFNRRPATRSAKRSGVWHDLAQSLAQRVDSLAAYAVRRAVSEQALRRTDADIRRARELMARRKLPSDVNLPRVRIRPIRSKVFS
jgi:hypothetical protein